jgi:hypothetical protein
LLSLTMHLLRHEASPAQAVSELHKSWQETYQPCVTVLPSSLHVCMHCCRIKDKAGCRPDDAEYNPRTLQIPNAATWFKQAKVWWGGGLCCCLLPVHKPSQSKLPASPGLLADTRMGHIMSVVQQALVWCCCLSTAPLPVGWLQVTEAQQQWWNFKADNFDSVLLFKVGKFYEVRPAAVR